MNNISMLFGWLYSGQKAKFHRNLNREDEPVEVAIISTKCSLINGEWKGCISFQKDDHRIQLNLSQKMGRGEVLVKALDDRFAYPELNTHIDKLIADTGIPFSYCRVGDVCGRYGYGLLGPENEIVIPT